MRTNKIDTKEIGLAIGHIVGKYFLKTEDLHYGYWTDDLEVNINNLAKAQDQYSDFILSQIPERTKSILDVGAGAGNITEKLLNNGFEVDCVSPSSFFNGLLNDRLKDRSHIFQSNFEDLSTERKYDLILFSESLSYININKALQKSFELLTDNGYLLICDFFKTDDTKDNQIRGGHKLSSFDKKIDAIPFNKINEIDITDETAPTIQLQYDFVENVVDPIRKLVSRYLFGKYPRLMKVIIWKYRKRLNKLNQRFFSGDINQSTFQKYRTYRLMVYQKNQ